MQPGCTSTPLLAVKQLGACRPGRITDDLFDWLAEKERLFSACGTPTYCAAQGLFLLVPSLHSASFLAAWSHFRAVEDGRPASLALSYSESGHGRQVDRQAPPVVNRLDSAQAMPLFKVLY